MNTFDIMLNIKKFNVCFIYIQIPIQNEDFTCEYLLPCDLHHLI